MQNRYSIRIEYVDERLTSRIAESRFAEERAAGTLRRKDAGRVDALAAQVIWENWLIAMWG